MDTTQHNETKTGMPDMRKAEARELLLKVKERFKVMSEFDHENRDEAMKDLKFTNVPGEQWEYNMKQERGQRPCYEFNKTRIAVKRVINDMRANRPDAKVRAVEDGDTEKAQIREGLIRNVCQMSDFDTIIDYEAEYQVAAGMGCWRVTTEYIGDDAFNQDITIKAFRNPFTVFVDPQCRDGLKRDARDWCITEMISHDSFEERWPDAEIVEFDTGEGDAYDDEGDWTTEKQVRIAEYWYKKPVKKEIWEVVFAPSEEELAEDPEAQATTKIVDSTTDEATGIDPQQIKRRRTVNSSQICWVICSGDRILDRGEWAGSMFPFVMVYGEYAWIDGQPYWWGLPRFAKDAQRSYNVARTAISETIAQAPKTYFWATAKQAEGHLNEWKQAHKKNYPYMLYNPDPKAGSAAPQRQGGADVPVALIQESQIASDELKAVTGIFDASMGAAGNETSGIAIARRQQQGEIATFNYQDNMSKGVQRTYEIILDLIPHIYDTERSLRVLGSDGAEDYKKVNEVVLTDDKRMTKVNDLSEGKYDVTITSGPSFSTLRQEAAETYGQLAQQFPEIMGVAGDLVMKSMDLPYADDIADRLRTLLPPQIQEMLNADKEVPPEVMEKMAQVEQAMAAVEEKAMLVQEAEAELQDSVAQNEKSAFQNKLNQKELEKKVETLRRVKAEFDTHIARELAGLDEKEAQLTATSAEGEPDPAVLAVAQVVRSLDDTMANFMQQADQTIGELQTIANRKPVSSRPVREDGKLFSEVTYDDGETIRVEVNPDGEDVADG